MSIDKRVKDFYKLAKQQTDDTNLQEAADIIEFLRRSQGALQGWNDRYRKVNAELKSEIVHIGKTNELLEVELATLNQEMLSLTHERARIIAHREKVIAELKTIHTEVEIATAKVKETQSLFGKFSILWSLIQSLFFSDYPEDFGKIEHSILPDPNKPQMANDIASIQKSLLDK